MSGHKQIGSDFHSPGYELFRVIPENPPWDMEGETTEYAQTGRQILNYLAESLGSAGYSNLIVPDYFCESMVIPFTQKGWSLTLVETNELISMKVEDLRIKTQGPLEKTVVLDANYFGKIPDKDLCVEVDKLHNRGVPVISDETHRVFTPGGINSTFAFGSLRKLLPVADGAYLRHNFSSPLLTRLEKNTVSERRWKIMDESGPDLAERKSDNLKNLRMQVNSELERNSKPSQMSKRTKEVLSTLDYQSLRNVRVLNSRYLANRLTSLGVRILNINPSVIVPTHLVIFVEDAREKQKALASAGIYCPIHWAKPADFPESLSWRANLLSLPIDHRYGKADMDKIAVEISKRVMR